VGVAGVCTGNAHNGWTPMNTSHHEPVTRPRRKSALKLTVGALTLALAGTLTAMALAASGALTVTSASNSKLGERIVVDAQGATLYTLSPERTHHLLCKSSECLKFWPPLTVHSSNTRLKAGPGVDGSLGTLRRSNGKFQVTLAGKPIYRYAGDTAKGDANGQNIHSFGGIWHVISAAAGASPPPSTPTVSTPTTSAPEPGYGY
jgi:predicted lipoprotein with Yx(FWY)xxD motif